MSLRFNGRGFECPKCGPLEYVLEYEKVWLCYKVYPSQDPDNWVFERNEAEDISADHVEYECPKCKEVFYHIEGLE